MTSRALAALGASLALAGAACHHRAARPPGALAPATGLPTAFTPVEWPPPSAPGAPQGPPTERCALTLRDDRDGTRLQLMRSQSTAGTTQRGDTTVTRYTATGDYAVTPAGRYGVSPRQWLRVECGTFRGLGIVAQGT